MARIIGLAETRAIVTCCLQADRRQTAQDKSDYHIGHVSKNTFKPKIWVTFQVRYLLHLSIPISNAVSHAMHAWTGLSRVNSLHKLSDAVTRSRMADCKKETGQSRWEEGVLERVWIIRRVRYFGWMYMVLHFTLGSIGDCSCPRGRAELCYPSDLAEG